MAQKKADKTAEIEDWLRENGFVYSSSDGLDLARNFLARCIYMRSEEEMAVLYPLARFKKDFRLQGDEDAASLFLKLALDVNRHVIRQAYVDSDGREVEPEDGKFCFFNVFDSFAYNPAEKRFEIAFSCYFESLLDDAELPQQNADD